MMEEFSHDAVKVHCCVLELMSRQILEQITAGESFNTRRLIRRSSSVVQNLRGDATYIEAPTYVSKCLTEFAHLRNVFTANGYPDRLLRSTLPGRNTTMNTRSRTTMERPAPNLLFLPYIAGVREKIDCVCRPLSDLWLQGQDGRSSSESEAAHP